EGDSQRMVFKGLETVRTDWTPLAQRFQQELYLRVFRNEPYQDSNDQQISINISIPLDAFMPSTYATYNMNSAKDGDTTHTVG
ncbi:fimbria/pilus outer membrane usher protein, partial [Salmonella enterica subsp. enterica serovar Anatum]|nr:fimbria/pilus outer membrane usher protein [Salmonella enterica subsp. enterica serovar Anatum]